MQQEQVHVKNTKMIMKQLECIIKDRNQNLEICLWRTLESTLDIILTFTPKSVNYDNGEDGHLTTIINACTLLSSVLKLILSRFKKSNAAVTVEVDFAVKRLMLVVKRIKQQQHDDAVNYMTVISACTYQLTKSLLFVFVLDGESNSNRAYHYTNDFYQEQEEEEGMQQLMLTRAIIKSSESTRKIQETGKRIIRSFTHLKKPSQDIQQPNSQQQNQDPKRSKIDQQDRTFILPSQDEYLLHQNKKSNIRILFSNDKYAIHHHTSNKKKTNHNTPLQNLFDSSSEHVNQVDSGNKRASSTFSPSSSVCPQNIIPTKTLPTIQINNGDDIEPSDSGCFTMHKPITPIQRTNLTSIQKEFAEPIFIKQQENHQQQQPQKQSKQQSHNITMSSIFKPWTSHTNSVEKEPSTLRRQTSQLSLIGKLYNINSPGKSQDSSSSINNSNSKNTPTEQEVTEKAGLQHSIIQEKDRNGKEILVLEKPTTSDTKLLVVAGTLGRLFTKLADETSQDLDFVDTFIQSHLFFTNSFDLLENLIIRFRLEQTWDGGGRDNEAKMIYLKKWQRCIQAKVLNVISRWIKLQFQDFKTNPTLVKRLSQFLDKDVNRAGFTIEVDMIKEALDRQTVCTLKTRHSTIIQSSQSLLSFGNNSSGGGGGRGSLGRRPSVTPSFLSFVSYSTPPESPTTATASNELSVLLSLNSKDVAKYLTLADFYILKCITAQDYLAMFYPATAASADNDKSKKSAAATVEKVDYIGMMTKRANQTSQWVVRQVNAHKIHGKQRRMTIRKLIEIAKLCVSWNNYHTCIVITMGLAQLEEFRDFISTSTSASTASSSSHWLHQQLLLPSKELSTLKQLFKYLNVGNNMAYYRSSFQKSTCPTSGATDKTNSYCSPCIPFFPIILKDLTFLMEGNANKTRKGGLINFVKYRMVMTSIHNVLNCTVENYFFASELECFPFFPGQPTEVNGSGGSLDNVAVLVEASTNATTS